MNCDTCTYFAWDEDSEEYVCEVDMDEDEVYRLQMNHYKECPFYRNGDEYQVVRHQL